MSSTASGSTTAAAATARSPTPASRRDSTPTAVSDALTELGDNVDITWTTLDATSLAAHVVATHHTYLWEELPLLDALATKVHSVHVGRHPELDEVADLVTALRDDLEPHMLKEERVLFPAIAALAAGQREFPFGSVANPIRMMVAEHDRAGELLTRLRAVTTNYSVPPDACASYRSLYERLAAVEADTHVHIHKENHVLFPAALRLAEVAPDSSASRSASSSAARSACTS